MLRRLATSTRWTDLELLFGKRSPQLSEISWEALENLRQIHSGLLEDSIDSAFIQARLDRCSAMVHARSRGLDNCFRFKDETVLGLAGPCGLMQQHEVYNGHKQTHALNYQAFNAPDGLTQHLHGPIELQLLDWTLYVRSRH